MSRNQNLSWTIQNEDLSTFPLGYEVELGDGSLVYPASATHSTFSRTGEFEVSINGDGVFEPYPMNGLYDATTKTVVRMLRNGETPTSVLIVGNDFELLKMSLDCKTILMVKQICEPSVYKIDSVSCDSSGKIWVKDTGGVMTVLDRQFRVLNTFRLPKKTLFAAVDPFRRLLWQVSKTNVTVTRTEDMSLVSTATLPVNVSSVTDWDFSGPSGTLFAVLNGSLAVSVSQNGTVISITYGATGICQWGAKGALVCVPSSNRIDHFDGTSVFENISGATLGMTHPTRISSTGKEYAIIMDSNGLAAKVDDNWTAKWFLQASQLFINPDVRVTSGPTELGRVTYITSTNGVSAHRDMINESWTYGSQLTRLPHATGSAYPIVAIFPELNCGHVWARITAVSTADEEQRKSNSSGSSESSSWNKGIGFMSIGSGFIIG